MKTKIFIITLSLSIGVFTACTDKKKSKDKKPEVKIETEIISKENKTSVENNADLAEKRRLDSIRQVKEHGHVH